MKQVNTITMAVFITLQRLSKNIIKRPVVETIRAYSSISNHPVSDGATFNEDLPIELEKNPFEKPKPQCVLCKYKITPDYKNVRLLSQFVSSFTGRVYGRHITGLCMEKQKKLEQEIRKAQSAALMPYILKDPIYFKDPKLYDPDNPLRPHRF